MSAVLVTVRRRRLKGTFGAIAGLAASVLAALVLWRGDIPADPAPPTAVALAVLGDSTSHSYQDSLNFPLGSADRGGPYRVHTFQWTEVLARLRGHELNPGPWTQWGWSRQAAWLRSLIGLHAGRTPRKEDYLYNFAFSGAVCSSLVGGLQQHFGQAAQLVELMNLDPERWRNGVVVIRIVNNDWAAVLDGQARDPKSPEVRAVAAHCVDRIAAAMRLLHTSHPGVRILLVGADNEADSPLAFDRYRSAAAIANIRAAFDDFNTQLRELAGADKRIAFFDLEAWFQGLWGTRGPDGAPEYKAVAIGEELRVTNTIGDEPTNAVLADDHGGLVWNVLWAQSLVARLREAFDLPLTPISEEEVARFVTVQRVNAR